MTDSTSSANLQAAIATYVLQGYRVVSQTETSAQLIKPKRIHPLIAILAFLFFGIGLVLYLLIFYLAMQDQVVYLQADEHGKVFDVARQAHQTEHDYRPGIPSASRRERGLVGAGALLLIIGGLLAWPAPEGRVLALCFGALLLAAALSMAPSAGERYAAGAAAALAPVAIFCLAIVVHFGGGLGVWSALAGCAVASLGGLLAPA